MASERKIQENEELILEEIVDLTESLKTQQKPLRDSFRINAERQTYFVHELFGKSFSTLCELEQLAILQFNVVYKHDVPMGPHRPRSTFRSAKIHTPPPRRQ